MEQKATQVVEKKSSEFEVAKSCLSFEIKNFRDYRAGEEVSSEDVAIMGFKASWSVIVKPQNFSEKYLAVELKIKNFPESELTPKYRYKFEMKTNHYDFIFTPTFIAMDQNVKLEGLSRTAALKNITSMGSLIIEIVVTIKSIQLPTFTSKFHDPVALCNNTLANLMTIMNDPTFSDFTFVVKGEEFKVHRNILAAASPVMRGMFCSELGEGLNRKCKVDLIQPEVFRSMLQIVYYGNLPEKFTELAKELYEAAHYYQIESLENLCKSEIRSQLCEKNAEELFEFAHRFDLMELKSEALEVVKRY